MSFDIVSPSEQIAEHLRDEMLKGRWVKALPGTPTLAKEMDVDRKTVTAAIKILEKEGLTQAQGLGRKRRITLSDSHSRCLTIQVLLYENNDQQIFFINQMMHRMRIGGHRVSMAKRSLSCLDMDVKKVARYVKKNPADAWIVFSASHDILEWFAKQEAPALAIFGRRRQVSMPSVGPDKEPAIRAAVRRLVELGHRNIVYLAREERRKPSPGYIENCYLDELDRLGIPVNVSYNLPDWEDNTASFQECLGNLLKQPSFRPTAIILDESQFFVAALLHLSQLNLVVPRNISLICSDAQTLFDWCQPNIAHIRWDEGAVVERVLRWTRQLARRRTVYNNVYHTRAEFVEGGTVGPAPTSAVAAARQ